MSQMKATTTDNNSESRKTFTITGSKINETDKLVSEQNPENKPHETQSSGPEYTASKVSTNCFDSGSAVVLQQQIEELTTFQQTVQNQNTDSGLSVDNNQVISLEENMDAYEHPSNSDMKDTDKYLSPNTDSNNNIPTLDQQRVQNQNTDDISGENSQAIGLEEIMDECEYPSDSDITIDYDDFGDPDWKVTDQNSDTDENHMYGKILIIWKLMNYSKVLTSELDPNVNVRLIRRKKHKIVQTLIETRYLKMLIMRKLLNCSKVLTQILDPNERGRMAR